MEWLSSGETCEGEGVVELASWNGSLNLPTCATHLDGTESQASAETCNLEDDDCDGAIDEDPISSSPCKIEGLYVRNRSAACTQGWWECDYWLEATKKRRLMTA